MESRLRRRDRRRHAHSGHRSSAQIAMARCRARVRILPVKIDPPKGVLVTNSRLPSATRPKSIRRTGHEPGYPFFIPGIAGQRAPIRRWTSRRTNRAFRHQGLPRRRLPRAITLFDAIPTNSHPWDFSKINNKPPR